jgi:hypothetical protein
MDGFSILTYLSLPQLLVPSLQRYAKFPVYRASDTDSIYQLYLSCSRKFAEIFAAQGAPPVSTTLAKLVAKFAAGVVDTGDAP